MNNDIIPYIEIRFSYSPSYIYQECIGLARRMPGFIPAEISGLGYNTLTYTYEQIFVYDVLFDFFIARVLRLKSTRVWFKGEEVELQLLYNLRWKHRKNYSPKYGSPAGLYDEFFRK